MKKSLVFQPAIWGLTLAVLGIARGRPNICKSGEHARLHARTLIQRILFLQGQPNLSQADLTVECKVAADLKAAMAACELAQDYVSRDMLGAQLEDTEMEHAYFLEKQLKLIGLVGLQNYLQSQMKPGQPT